VTEQQVVKVSFREAFLFLVRGFVPALAVALTAAAVAYLVSRNPEPVFRSTAILLATLPSTGYSSSVNVIEPTQVDPNIYRLAVIQGGLLEVALANVLGETPTPKELADWRRRVRVRVDENLISGLLRIEVDDKDQELAAQVANALASSLLAWDRDRVGRNIQTTATSLSRSVALLAAQIATAEQAGDDQTVQVLKATRDQRLAQLRAADALNLSAVVVGLLEPFKSAVADPRPVNDRTTFVTAVAFVLFFIFAYVLMFFIRVADPRIRTVDDLARATGILPWAAIPKEERGPEFLEAIARLALPLPVTSPLPSSAGGDAITHGHVIVVTSPTGISERSLLSRHLAMAYARAGWRVLLVDADLREGQVSASLPAPRRMTTLVELLRGAEDVGPATLANSFGGELDLIPSGTVPVDGAALLLGRRISGLIGSWRSRYDVVVIDSTSLTSSAGTLAMARDADAVVLAAKAYSTRLAAAQDAVNELARAGANLIGTVLTGAGTSGRGLLAPGPASRTNRLETKSAPVSRSPRAKVEQRPRRGT